MKKALDILELGDAQVQDSWQLCKDLVEPEELGNIFFKELARIAPHVSLHICVCACVRKGPLGALGAWLHILPTKSLRMSHMNLSMFACVLFLLSNELANIAPHIRVCLCDEPKSQFPDRYVT